jgi:hypothetical protein
MRPKSAPKLDVRNVKQFIRNYFQKIQGVHIAEQISQNKLTLAVRASLLPYV